VDVTSFEAARTGSRERAAEPLGDATLLWRAAGLLGLGTDSAAAGEAAGLIEFGARVRFRHPLVRAAAYRLASAEERQEAYRALAEVTDPDVDPDRRAWHRAHATALPDEEIAVELECSAGRTRARGGLVAAAALLERAARMTPEPVRRAQRELAAAWVKRDAGSLDAQDIGLPVFAPDRLTSRRCRRFDPDQRRHRACRLCRAARTGSLEARRTSRG
jgi:hypothetical protein